MEKFFLSSPVFPPAKLFLTSEICNNAFHALLSSLVRFKQVYQENTLILSCLCQIQDTHFLPNVQSGGGIVSSMCQQGSTFLLSD